MYLALLIVVALAGFISLSYEILWFRAFSFASGGAPAIFGQLLFFYLVGLAVGSFASRIFCRDRNATGDRRELIPLAGFVFVANLLGFLVLPLLAFFSTHFEASVAMPLVAVAAASWGAVLPLVSHFAIAPNELAGARVSYLYFANIVGSVAGTLLTGYVLLDSWTISSAALFVALLGLALSAVLLSRSASGKSLRMAGLVVIGLTGIAYAVETRALFDRFYERLLAGREYQPSHAPAQVVENRDGVILVTPALEVFGGGAYDGAISTSLVADKNMIVRAYGIAALHPAPRQVLMIGLSTGAWAQVIANMPDVEKLTVIEINRGYLRIIPQYPQVASLMRNPKVEIVIDDGRRWLTHHPERTFDVIVSNTTFHWRANATNLLSVEFLRAVRAHLKPGGIFHFNTTGSADAYETAFTVFPYGLRFINFATVSDSPIVPNEARWKEMLDHHRIDGTVTFDTTREIDRQRRARVLSLVPSLDAPPVSFGLEWRDHVLSRLEHAEVITDDNMIPEWRGADEASFPPRAHP
jgi:predicted membrane-bound spermidine synthase